MNYFNGEKFELRKNFAKIYRKIKFSREDDTYHNALDAAQAKIIERLPEAKDLIAQDILSQIRLDLQINSLFLRNGGRHRDISTLFDPILTQEPHHSLGHPVRDWYLGQNHLQTRVADAMESIAYVIAREVSMPDDKKQHRFSTIWWLSEEFTASLTYLKVLYWIQNHE